MRPFARILVFALALIALPAATGCTWLHSGTPGANTTKAIIDCTETAVIDAGEKALPDLATLVVQAITGTFSWTGLLAAFGGVEGLVQDGIAAITCDVDALAAYFESLTSNPTSAPTVAALAALKPTDYPVAAKLLRFYLAVKGRSVAKRAAVSPLLKLPMLAPAARP